MVIEKVIKVLAGYLDAEESDFTEDTAVFLEYDLDEDDIEAIVKKLSSEFDAVIDIEEFCELDSVEDMAEYIEGLC